MRTSLLFALVLVPLLAVAACGGKSTPDTTTTTTDTSDTADDTTDDTTKTPDDSIEAVTPEACESGGGTVAWDIGDGSVQCPAGTTESSKVSGGVEPGLCCKPAPASAE